MDSPDRVANPFRGRKKRIRHKKKIAGLNDEETEQEEKENEYNSRTAEEEGKLVEL
jgi:Skp family chaperone for outer membrane proteins